MIHQDEAFAGAVTDRVVALERRTDAEVVVVVAARSGSYADVAARGASVVALAVAAVLLAIPARVAEPWFLLDLTLAWVLADRALRAPWAVRRLTRAARRAAQVRDAAHEAFHVEAVHATPRRTGLLVYVSVVEERVELVPDVGIDGAVPRGDLLGAVAGLRMGDAAALLAALDALGDVLARHLPHHADSDATDLPDAPRIRR